MPGYIGGSKIVASATPALGFTNNRLVRVSSSQFVNSLLSDDGTNVTLASGQHLAPGGTKAAPAYSFSGAGRSDDGMYSSAVSVLAWAEDGAAQMQLDDGGLILRSIIPIGWSSGEADLPADLLLVRDAANILAQRNGTNAQVTRAYRTFTDASNYERWALQSGAGFFELASETAGTGTDNIDLRLTPAGTGLVTTATGIRSSGATAGIGYATGAGGTVTQDVSKSTGVTLNTVTGEITMNAESLGADGNVTFTLTNSAIASGDYVMVQHVRVAQVGSYSAVADSAAGSASITVHNLTAGARAEAIVLKFVVFKAVTS